ncbi:MAG: TonB-dependent receptor plug domain-containing protein, partial [Bryobacteraceae bacterium]
MKHWETPRGCIAFVSLFAAASLFALPAAAQSTKKDLGSMSIEELLNLEVTSAAKKPEPLAKTAAAIYVINSDDIRRSGARNVPDLLRMVPGINVQQIDASNWAISARGLNGEYSNKLLVLVDGRSVYSAEFSGVFWDAQDVLLEDIDRIEVIRGPGAALWGTNAVNGVINILTKNAADTQGGLLVTEGGSFGGEVAARYGGKMGSRGFYSIYAKELGENPNQNGPGIDAHDRHDLAHLGFRMDWKKSSRNVFTLHGDVLGGRADETFGYFASLSNPAQTSVPAARGSLAGNLTGSWDHTSASGSSFNLQGYFDRQGHDSILLREHVNTGDFEAQYRFHLRKRQEITAGLDYRLIDIHTQGGFALSFAPPSALDSLWSGFVEDEISVVPDRLRVTLGARLEQNPYDGLEFQPDIRLLWSPRAGHTIWLASTRALR